MRSPQSPPEWQILAKKIAPDRMAEITRQAFAIWQKDSYLHWNDLRRRPTPEGLTHEEWWYLVKMGRASGKFIPLQDIKGNFCKFTMPDSVIANLHAIDSGLGSAWNLPDAVRNPSTRNEYIVSTLIQEAITSSQLEGAATTREIAKDMLRSGRKPRDRDERMIVNNYQTMQQIMALRTQALTPDLVCALHRSVTEGTLDRPDAAGRFRRADELVQVTDLEGTVFHDPPPAAELDSRMELMCAFANGTLPGNFIHPLIRAILLHFWLAYDHPFVDGNGRTARALFYCSMLRQGYSLFEFIYISQIILKAPVQYAMAFLHVETDDADLTYFILHQTAVVEAAVKALHQYVNHRKAELQSAEGRLRAVSGLNHRQQMLLAHALRKPGDAYTIEGHRRTHGVVYQTARTDLLQLESLGLLTKNKSRRPWIFHAEKALPAKLDAIAAANPPASIA